MTRKHWHMCRVCKREWECQDHMCYRTGSRYHTYCHGNSCSQAVKPKKEKEKPPEEPSLFEEK